MREALTEYITSAAKDEDIVPGVVWYQECNDVVMEYINENPPDAKGSSAMLKRFKGLVDDAEDEEL